MSAPREVCVSATDLRTGPKVVPSEPLLDQIEHGLRATIYRVNEQTNRVAQTADTLLGSGNGEACQEDPARPRNDGRLHEALCLLREVNEAITLLAHQVNRLEVL